MGDSILGQHTSEIQKITDKPTNFITITPDSQILKNKTKKAALSLLTVPVLVFSLVFSHPFNSACPLTHVENEKKQVNSNKTSQKYMGGSIPGQHTSKTQKTTDKLT